MPATPSLSKHRLAPVRNVTHGDQTGFDPFIIPDVTGHVTHVLAENASPQTIFGSERGTPKAIPTSQSLPSSPFRTFSEAPFRSPKTPSTHRRRIRDAHAASAFYTPRRAPITSIPVRTIGFSQVQSTSALWFRAEKKTEKIATSSGVSE